MQLLSSLLSRYIGSTEAIIFNPDIQVLIEVLSNEASEFERQQGDAGMVNSFGRKVVQDSTTDALPLLASVACAPLMLCFLLIRY